jgi:hypothetical protein
MSKKMERLLNRLVRLNDVVDRLFDAGREMSVYPKQRDKEYKAVCNAYTLAERKERLTWEKVNCTKLTNPNSKHVKKMLRRAAVKVAIPKTYVDLGDITYGDWDGDMLYGHIVVKSNGAEIYYTSNHYKTLGIGQLITLDGHARPYFVKSIGDDGRYHILPVPHE